MSPRLRCSAFALVLAFGCQADDGGQPLIAGACGEIVDACHTKDDGSDAQISDCHTIAHDENEQECSNVHAMCVELCNAAPTVYGGTDSHDGTESHEGSGEHGETTDHGTTTDHDESTGHDHTSSTGDDPTDATGTTTGDTGGTTAADEPSCSALGSGCHDTATPLGMMCHDVGHDGDEAACAKIWAECKKECGF
jgi:hypothetical protein